MKRNKLFKYVIAVVLIAFASLTIFMSSSVLFDWFGIREKQGDYVPFIVWTNFIAGFLYLVSAYGFLKAKEWSFKILLNLTILFVIALIALALYINYDGAFEIKTVKAMLFRTGLTILFFVLVYFNLKKKGNMREFTKIIVAIGAVLILSSFKKLPLQNTFSLTIEVKELRNSKGLVQFALYNEKGTIPDEKYKHYYKLGTAVIDDRSATYTFFDLPSGRYAVNVLHDENQNGKIDKGLILSKEGIGFSNYEKIGLLNKPNFSKANFELTKDCRKRIKIIYM